MSDLICTICNVPKDLHGTCCGWENASTPCNASMIITDNRHPGFGQNLDLWKHTFLEGNEDAADIAEKSGYRSGWDAAYAQLQSEKEALQKEVERIKKMIAKDLKAWKEQSEEGEPATTIAFIRGNVRALQEAWNHLNQSDEALNPHTP